jgi:hypothetical protein
MTDTTPLLFRISTRLLVAGSLAWLMKLAVIGMTESTDGTLVSVLWAAGFFAMLAGAALLAAWITRTRHLALRIVAALAGGVVFFMSMNVLDSLAKAVAGDAGPVYLEDEWGILLAALTWLAVALATTAHQRSSVTATSARAHS